jgi:hypothetical protein
LGGPARDVDMSFVDLTEGAEVKWESEIFDIEGIEVIELFRECERE